MYIYSVHNFHLLFFTSLISLLHFMMAALQSSNNSNISVISVLVSINYPQGLPYSWFDDWFSMETWMFWGMTLGDSGSYFNLWLELVSSDGGLAVSGSKRSLSFYQTLLPELTLGSVTRRQGTGEVHSCSWQVIPRRSGFCSTCRGQAMAARCALRPPLIWATWKTAATTRGSSAHHLRNAPSPRQSWPQAKDNLLYRRIANPLDTYPSYF